MVSIFLHEGVYLNIIYVFTPYNYSVDVLDFIAFVGSMYHFLTILMKRLI